MSRLDLNWKSSTDYSTTIRTNQYYIHILCWALDRVLHASYIIVYDLWVYQGRYWRNLLEEVIPKQKRWQAWLSGWVRYCFAESCYRVGLEWSWSKTSLDEANYSSALWLQKVQLQIFIHYKCGKRLWVRSAQLQRYSCRSTKQDYCRLQVLLQKPYRCRWWG